MRPPNKNDKPKKITTKKKAKETSVKNQTKITELFKPKPNKPGNTSDVKTQNGDRVNKSDQMTQESKVRERNISCSTDDALIANQSQECMMLEPSRIFQARNATPDLEKSNSAIILPTNNLL